MRSSMNVSASRATVVFCLAVTCLGGAGRLEAQVAPPPVSSPTAAAPSVEKVAPWVEPGVPLGILEVVTGGNWAEGGHSGIYRAVVVQRGREGARTVAVYLQWLSENEDGDPAAITASVPIREMEGRIVPSASVALESEVENDAQLTIAAPEAVDPSARLLVVRASGPGRYVVVPPIAAGANAASPPQQPPSPSVEPPKAQPKRGRH